MDWVSALKTTELPCCSNTWSLLALTDRSAASCWTLCVAGVERCVLANQRQLVKLKVPPSWRCFMSDICRWHCVVPLTTNSDPHPPGSSRVLTGSWSAGSWSAGSLASRTTDRTSSVSKTIQCQSVHSINSCRHKYSLRNWSTILGQ